MKRLLTVFLLLVAVAAALAWVGILLSPSTPSLGRRPVVLTLTLDRPVFDYLPGPANPLLRQRTEQSMAMIYQALRLAREDDQVRGLILHIQNARLGLGKAQEFLALLDSFRQAEKFVECYLETAGEGTNGTVAYFLASGCDRISLAPMGDLNLIGLYSEGVFLRGALDKLKIDPQFDAAGEYKSAAEQYTLYQHSPAASEALGAVLDDLFDQIVMQIATARNLDPQQVRGFIDRAPLTAQEALAAGLVDFISYPDEFDARLDEDVADEAHRLPLSAYQRDSGSPGSHSIAVVFTQGTIVRGRNGVDPWTQQRFAGSDAIAEILRELAERSSVDAVVLRIDSPGGSALASDLMLREVTRLAETKPVVVSMSDVAASGGYYIAVGAARIVAAPATITGSIGVVGGKFVTRRLQEEILGISHDVLMRGANANFYSTLEPFTPEQSERFRLLLERTYDAFLDHVAAGRKLPRESVEEVARGRIWTGRQALDLGLVDDLGGLDRALELVRSEAGIDPDDALTLEFYPRPLSLLDLLSRGLEPWMTSRLTTPWGLLPPRSPLPLELSPEVLSLLSAD